MIIQQKIHHDHNAPLKRVRGLRRYLSNAGEINIKKHNLLLKFKLDSIHFRSATIHVDLILLKFENNNDIKESIYSQRQNIYTLIQNYIERIFNYFSFEDTYKVEAFVYNVESLTPCSHPAIGNHGIGKTSYCDECGEDF